MANLVPGDAAAHVYDGLPTGAGVQSYLGSIAKLSVRILQALCTTVTVLVVLLKLNMRIKHAHLLSIVSQLTCKLKLNFN